MVFFHIMQNRTCVLTNLNDLQLHDHLLTYPEIVFLSALIAYNTMS